MRERTKLKPGGGGGGVLSSNRLMGMLANNSCKDHLDKQQRGIA